MKAFGKLLELGRKFPMRAYKAVELGIQLRRRAKNIPCSRADAVSFKRCSSAHMERASDLGAQPNERDNHEEAKYDRPNDRCVVGFRERLECPSHRCFFRAGTPPLQRVKRRPQSENFALRGRLDFELLCDEVVDTQHLQVWLNVFKRS